MPLRHWRTLQGPTLRSNRQHRLMKKAGRSSEWAPYDAASPELLDPVLCHRKSQCFTYAVQSTVKSGEPRPARQDKKITIFQPSWQNICTIRSQESSRASSSHPSTLNPEPVTFCKYDIGKYTDELSRVCQQYKAISRCCRPTRRCPFLLLTLYKRVKKCFGESSSAFFVRC